MSLGWVAIWIAALLLGVLTEQFIKKWRKTPKEQKEITKLRPAVCPHVALIQQTVAGRPWRYRCIACDTLFSTELKLWERKDIKVRAGG